MKYVKKKSTKAIIKTNKPTYTVNETLADSRAELHAICSACGKVHFIEEDAANPTKVKDVIENWKQLGGFMINNKCNYCTSKISLDLYINAFNAIDFWAWVWANVLIENKTVEAKVLTLGGGKHE